MQPAVSSESAKSSRHALLQHYCEVRAYTETICEKLAIEDHVVQPCPEVSPPKWHLGHTTWFFEEMLLVRFLPAYERHNSGYGVLFNSYYKGAGKHWVQAERGQLSRPTVAEVMEYRQQIDKRVIDYLQEAEVNEEAVQIIELGLQHEQQHQELLYMDIKYILGVNPSLPAYSGQPLPTAPEPQQQWTEFEEGVYEIGHGSEQFAYDNERPRHKSYLHPFKIRRSLITNAEYQDFIKDGGYDKPEFWLSKGYDFVQENNIRHPLYWMQKNDEWYEYSLHGLIPLNENTPVSHISYFEADAFARWHGARLPTEQEYETALITNALGIEDSPPLALHPYNANAGNQLWCWTASHYSPYPGFKTFSGPLQEYNGKFMCNQFVLRGGCIATSSGHLRTSYRNFYEPHQRWMFSGIRLARDLT